ncbi:hypothetical protein BpHYR1_015223, partial [Brachionus plicatilis]
AVETDAMEDNIPFKMVTLVGLLLKDLAPVLNNYKLALL